MLPPQKIFGLPSGKWCLHGPLSHTRAYQTSDPLVPFVALSGNECLHFSLSLRLCLVTTFAALQSPGGPGTGQLEEWIHGLMTLTKILVLVYIYYLKCATFGQLILMKMIKIVDTRCQILRQKCTKLDFGWGCYTDPAGGLRHSPNHPS